MHAHRHNILSALPSVREIFFVTGSVLVVDGGSTAHELIKEDCFIGKINIESVSMSRASDCSSEHHISS